MVIGRDVPWNAGWSGENRYEIRPCRWAGGAPAIWSPHAPGIGSPLFAKPHMVRQRQSVARFLCTVCGRPTPPADRWWFELGEFREGYFMTTEAPVHRACADHAQRWCPHLRRLGGGPRPFPAGALVMKAIIGGPAFEADFRVRVQPGQHVVGHLRFAWPRDKIALRP